MKWRKIFTAVSLALAFAAASFAFGGHKGQSNLSIVTAAPTPADKPLFTAYRGIELGMSADEAHKKLGNPKESENTQDFYQFSDNESAQLYYDDAHKVMAISITYTGKLDSAPTPRTVFGEDGEVKADGGIFKMERYPKAGFWISYTRTGGDDPIVVLALQKI
jgi:hypothetical protein